MRVERGDKDQHSTNPVSLASFAVLSDLGLQPESTTVDALLHTILLVERHHHHHHHLAPPHTFDEKSNTKIVYDQTNPQVKKL